LKEGLAKQRVIHKKRMRKLIEDSILDEEVKNDEQSKRKSQTKSSANEATFRTPSEFTPTKRSGSNRQQSTLNTSGSSMNSQSQPQAN